MKSIMDSDALQKTEQQTKNLKARSEVVPWGQNVDDLSLEVNPHKNGLVTLAPKIIGLNPHDLNHGGSRLASLRWKPGSTYKFNNIFNETEMIEFMEHVLAF